MEEKYMCNFVIYNNNLNLIKKYGNIIFSNFNDFHLSGIASNKKELEELGLKYEQVNKIISLVKTHMGKWMSKFKMPVPETLGQYLLCTADVMASRKEWNQLFQNEPVTIQEMMKTEVYENKKSKKL